MAISMKEGICSKCQSALVSVKEVMLSKSGSAGMSGFIMSAYMCGNCGYTELYSVRK